MFIRARYSSNKNSIGNKHFLPQQLRKENVIKFEPSESLNSIQMKLFNGFSTCCMNLPSTHILCVEGRHDNVKVVVKIIFIVIVFFIKLLLFIYYKFI